MVMTRNGFSLFVLVALAAMTLPACGGGGGGGGGSPDAPASLVYDDMSPLYRTDSSIVPNNPQTTGGAPTLYEVLPALPPGLALSAVTGVISGNPAAPAAPTAHTITASNSAGSTQAVVSIEVKWIQFKSIEVQSPLSDADIRHLMERATFGFDQAVYDDINANGLPAYLTGALNAINPGATLALEVEADGYVEDSSFPNLTELALWWLHCIQRSPNPLQESLALHWHDHFACSSEVLNGTSAYWFFDHMDLWRHNAAGDLRDLILAMARDRTMLEYLDGRDSRKQTPNENFGREVMELYCFGVNNGYAQADIVAAAALFSGYRRTFDGTHHDITWTPTEHNDDDQTFLGVFFAGVTNPAADIYDQVVDTLLAHKPVGDTIGYASRWIVRSILRRYCIESPPQELIDQLATVLESGGWDLKPLFMTLFQSEAFYSSQSKVGFVKTPVEHIVGFIRTTGLPVQIERGNIGFGFTAGLDLTFVAMANRPSQPPVVAGWPEGESWLSAQGMVDRANVIDFVITSRGFQIAEGADPAALLPPGTPSAQQVVNAIAARMQIPLTPAEIAELVDYLNKDAGGSTTNDPFDSTNPVHIDERVRGLLYILGQHPQYVLR